MSKIFMAIEGELYISPGIVEKRQRSVHIIHYPPDVQGLDFKVPP
jgi:hypothetical protein